MLYYYYFMEDRNVTVNQPPVLLAQEYKAR